jgi:hypothetical protein
MKRRRGNDFLENIKRAREAAQEHAPPAQQKPISEMTSEELDAEKRRLEAEEVALMQEAVETRRDEAREQPRGTLSDVLRRSRRRRVPGK